MIFPKKPEILYAPMLATMGGGSATGFGRGVGGGFKLGTPFTFYDLGMAALYSTLTYGTDHDSQSVKDIRFSSGGFRCFIFPYNAVNGHKITQLELSTAYDLTSATSTTSHSMFSISGFETMWNFSQDGLHLTAGTRNNIKQYILSSPYDISNVNPSNYNSQISIGSNNCQGGGYNANGSLFWTYQRYGDDMVVYDLPTAYSFTNASVNSNYTRYSLNISSGTGKNIYGTHMSADGRYLAAIDSFQNQRVYITELSTAYNFQTNQGAVAKNFTSPAGHGAPQMGLAVTPDYVYFSDDYSSGQIRMYNATVFS